MVSSAAARARRVPSSRSTGWLWSRRSRPNEVSARPYLDTCLSTSWLDSTQVGGALAAAWNSSVLSITARSSAASQGQHR